MGCLGHSSQIGRASKNTMKKSSHNRSKTVTLERAACKLVSGKLAMKPVPYFLNDQNGLWCSDYK